jgi:uncharacterized protein YfaS (alpha-2-macroglobulin family)
MPSVSFIKARKDFRATAVFSPKLETEENGLVKLTVKMPDSLTRYRVVALATANTGLFGKAENNIVAQRKVNARTVAPRFLTQGDTFSVPVVVQNLDTAPRSIDVAVRATNLSATGPQGKRVIVPPGQRAEVRFDFATETRGKAVIQTVASAGDFADSSNVEVPVFEPATTESFATYGSVTDKPQFEQLKVPADVFPEVGGIEAEISSTQLQNLTDAYTAYRVTASPAFREPAGSKHDYAQVPVALGSLNMSLSINGKPAITSWKRGDVNFIGYNVPHESGNTGSTPQSFILIAIK